MDPQSPPRKKKEAGICAICLEEITVEKEAHLDSCRHTYCDNCITTWVQTQENQCPQCKARVKKIVSRDASGCKSEKVISDKRKSQNSHQGESEQEDPICIECQRVIPW